MRNIMRAAVLLFLLTSLALAAQNDIVGKWAANGRTRGGLGGMWLFEPNGNASLSFGALVDFRYSVKDHILKMVVNDPYAKTNEEDAASYEIIGDTLITNPTDTMRRQEMKRIGSPRQEVDPIVAASGHTNITQVVWQQWNLRALAWLNSVYHLKPKRDATQSKNKNSLLIPKESRLTAERY